MAQQFMFNYELHGSFENFLRLNPHIGRTDILVIEWISINIGTDTMRTKVSKAIVYYPYKITVPDVPTY